jgi:hypothetical protein
MRRFFFIFILIFILIFITNLSDLSEGPVFQNVAREADVPIKSLESEHTAKLWQITRR